MYFLGFLLHLFRRWIFAIDDPKGNRIQRHSFDQNAWQVEFEWIVAHGENCVFFLLRSAK